MKKLLAIIILGLLYSLNAYSHPGMTGPSGCHMDYSRGTQHCHKSKQPSPYKTYYYAKYRGQSYGPYSSYGSCMNAVRGANLIGAYCSTSKY